MSHSSVVAIEQQIIAAETEVALLYTKLKKAKCKAGDHDWRFSQGASPSESDYYCSRVDCHAWKRA